MKLVINLEWLIEKLSTNGNLTLARSIIKFIEDGDGFSYVYKTKDDHKNGTTSYLFWCNCHQELVRRTNLKDMIQQITLLNMIAKVLLMKIWIVLMELR